MTNRAERTYDIQINDVKKGSELTSPEVSGFPAEPEVLYLAVPRINCFRAFDLVGGVGGPSAVNVLSILVVRAMLHHVLSGDGVSPVFGDLVELEGNACQLSQIRINYQTFI